MFRFTLIAGLAILSASVANAVPGYAPALPAYAPALPAYAPVPVILPAPAAKPVALPQIGDASAAALTNAVGARASASKIDGVNRVALDRYGKEIGRPLLVRPYGDLTNLYAASLPPRSFVGQIEPAFTRDSYGNINYNSESSIGVAVI